MLKTLVACLAVLVAFPASAACVWTLKHFLDTNSATGLSATVVCDSGTEAIPTDATDGIPCAGLTKIMLRAQAASGQTFTAAPAGTIRIAVYSSRAAVGWARCPDCSEPTITEVSVRVQSFAPWTVTCREGDRIAFYPNGVTLSAGALTLYVDGFR